MCKTEHLWGTHKGKRQPQTSLPPLHLCVDCGVDVLSLSVTRAMCVCGFLFVAAAGLQVADITPVVSFCIM